MRYETMLIFETAVARADGNQVKETIESLITKCGGSDIDIEVYGERKLAYQVGKRSRGAYYLVHFNMEGTSVPALRREFKLNEDIFRYMIQVDRDAESERRDLTNPRMFNVDATDSKGFFEKGSSSNTQREPVAAAAEKGEE